jgi:hypothetical protein
LADKSIDLLTVPPYTLKKLQGIGTGLPIHLIESAKQIKPFKELSLMGIVCGKIILKKKLQGGLPGSSTYSHELINKKFD